MNIDNRSITDHSAPSTPVDAPKQRIIPRLEELLVSVDRLNPSQNKESYQKLLQTPVLEKALLADQNISDRLAEIATAHIRSPIQECRQLNDMKLYLILLNNHSQSENTLTAEEKTELSSLVKRVGEAVRDFAETITPPKWTSPLQQLEEIVKSATAKESPIPQVPSLLNSHQGTPIKEKVFASIHAEALIKGSKLEGNGDIQVLHYFNEYLERNKNAIPESSTLQKMYRDAEALAIAGDIDTRPDNDAFSKDFDIRQKTFSTTLNTLVKELKPGEKTLVPIGWCKHSMKMSIEKDEHGLLRLLVFNTGAGLSDYHASLLDEGKTYYQPFIEINGVEEKHLFDKDFMQAFLEVMLIARHLSKEKNLDTNYSAKDVYGNLFSLGGNVIICHGEREKFILPQASGVCTWASNQAVLHTLLPTDSYYALINNLDLDSICSYYQSVKDKLLTDEPSRILLKHAALRCSQNTLDAYTHKAISLERLLEIHATLKELQGVIKNAEGEVGYAKSVQGEVNFTKVEPEVPQLFGVAMWDLADPDKPIAAPTANAAVAPFPFEWMQDPKQIANGLEKMNEHIRSQESAATITNFFTLIAQDGQEELWNTIPPDQLEKTIVQLTDLGEHLFKTYGSGTQNTYATYAFYLNALTFKLGSQIPELKMDAVGFDTKAYSRVVSASLSGGTMVSDRNLYTPAERELRRRTLNIFDDVAHASDNALHFSVIFDHDKRFGNNQIPKELGQKASSMPEAQYIDTLLSTDPSIAEKIKTRFPEEKAMDSREGQIALALSDFHGAILPPAFCALRRQAFFSKAILEGVNLKETGPLFQPRVSEDREGKNYIVEFKGSTMTDNSVSSRDFRSENLFNELISIRKTQNEPRQILKKRVYDSEADVMLKGGTEWQRNLQLILAQGDIDNQNPHFEQQLIKTLAYFTQNIERLSEHDMRMLCRYLLFEGDYLEKVLEINPQSKELLLQFVERGYHYFAERKEIGGVIFFIELGRSIDSLLRFKQLPSSFPDYREKLINLVTQGGWTQPEHLSLIYQQIAASYADKPLPALTKDDAQLLLTAFIHNKVYPLSATQHTKDQMQAVKRTMSKEIENVLKGAGGSEICTAVVRTFRPTVSQHMEWDCHTQYPLCISQDGVYILNAETQDLTINHQSLTGLPFRIQYDETFKKLFQQSKYTCNIVGASCYEFIDERGNTTRIDTVNYKGLNELRFRQKFENGYWYELTNTSKLSSYINKSIYDLSSDFISLCLKSHLWIPIEEDAPLAILIKDSSLQLTHTIRLDDAPEPLSLDEQMEIYHFLTQTSDDDPSLSAEEKVIRAALLNSTRSLNALPAKEKKELRELSDKPLYKRTTPEEDKKEKNIINHFIKTTAATPQLKAAQKALQRAKIGRSPFVIESVEKNISEKEAWSLVNLKDAPSSTFQTLFEKGMLWRNQQGDLKALELPSLGLSFDMRREDGAWRAYSEEHPGFFVASNQRYNTLQAIPEAIVLENKLGKRKLILPYGHIRQISEGSLHTNFEIIIVHGAVKRSISIDLDTNLSPIPLHKEQQIYLATLLLAQKQYGPAQTLLRASFSHVIPYSNEEIKLLKEIVNISSNSKDESPHATAVAYTALSLLPPEKKLTITNPDWIRRAYLKDTRSFLEKYHSYQLQESLIPDLTITNDEQIKGLTYLLSVLSNSEAPEDVSACFSIFGLTMKLGISADSLSIPSASASTKQKTAITATDLHTSIRNARTWHDIQNLNMALVTRPLHTFQYRFYDMYRLALTDPAKLEIHLVGAEQEVSVPKDLITLLRNVGRTTRHPELKTTTFPPLLKQIHKIIEEKDEDSFTEILTNAKEVEKNWADQQQISRAQTPALQGKTPAPVPRKLEAQAITAGRPQTDIPILLEPIPKRKPLLPKKQFEAFQPIPNQGLQLSPAEIAALKKAITDKGTGDQPQEAEELARHIETFWTLPLHSKEWHKLAPETLSNTKTHLLVEQAEMGKHIRLLEQELLAAANALPPDAQKAVFFETEKMGGMRQPIHLRDLLLFAARSRHFSFTGKNPTIAGQERELLNMTLRYLDVRAQQQQLNRAIGSLTALEGIKNTDSKVYAQLSETLYAELKRQTPYEAHKNPELLVYEVLEEVGLHDWQVKDLQRMLSPQKGENTNIILEKVMGSGKSKLYLPILALSKADGDHLSFIVVHSSQYESVAQNMQIKQGQNFSQVAHTINFNRESDTSIEALQKILRECQLVRKQRHFFVITDKTIHSLALASDLLWESYLNSTVEDPNLVKRLELMREILNLFTEKGKATLDEADLLLNCRFEMVYALGDPKSINPAHANIVADLYRCLAPHLAQLTPFTRGEYEAKKGALIDTFVQEVVAKEMPSYDAEKIKSYLHGTKEGDTYVNTLPPETRNLLAIAQYEFKELLPMVLDKRCGEHYGYSDNPDKILPVPYVASDVPSPTAEFSFPYALLDYTVETIQHAGVSPTLLKTLIQGMQSRAAQERKLDPTLGIEDTDAYKQFRELCGKVSIPFLNVNDGDIARLAAMYQDRPPEAYSFAKKYLFPAITLHPRKLTSTSFTLNNQFYEVQGFTGTPWNAKTYPKSLQVLRDTLSAGKTQGIIWKNSQKVHQLGSDKFEEIIKSLKDILATGEFNGFFDVGAVFNGVDNETVADALMEVLPPSIKGITFFKDNRACVKERGKGIIPFEQCSLSKEQLFYYYDQWHTTGSDFKIANKSLLSVGKNKMRDLEQGYMRDREAALGPRVELLLTPESRQCIDKELHLDESTPGTAEILRYTEIIQERELKEQLLMASFGRIKETTNTYLQSVLRNPRIPPAQLWKKREIILKLIGDTIEDAPYEQFGRFQEATAAKEFFQRVIDETILKLEPLIHEMDLPITKKMLEDHLWACIDLELLPKEISAAAKMAPEQCVEKQTQQQAQVERMALVNKEMMSDVAATDRSGTLHWNWESSLNTSKSSFYRLATPDQLQNDTLPTLATHNVWLSTSQGQPPFFAAKDVLAAEPELEQFSDIFDFEVSYNFLAVEGKVRHEATLTEVHNKPFERGQLEVKNLLICKDNKTNQVVIRLVSQADAGFFFSKLGQDKKAGEKSASPEHEVNTMLYHTVLGVLQTNGEDIPLDTEIQKKIAQAKFFNGDIIYSRAEFELLIAWIKDEGIGRMQQLFDHILLAKPEKRADYPSSRLGAFFQSHKFDRIE